MSSESTTQQDTDRCQQRDSIDYIAASWCMIPPHVREAIVTLVDAGLMARPESEAGPSRGGDGTK